MAINPGLPKVIEALRLAANTRNWAYSELIELDMRAPNDPIICTALEQARDEAWYYNELYRSELAKYQNSSLR